MDVAGPLAGQCVVFTGPLDGPLRGWRRHRAARLVHELGGRCVGGVSRHTTLLVASRADTAKARRATDLGVRVVTPTEFAEMAGCLMLW